MTRRVVAVAVAVTVLALWGGAMAQAPGGPRFVGNAPPPATALSLWYRAPAADRPPVPRPAKAVATAARETGVARRRTKLSDDFASR